MMLCAHCTYCGSHCSVSQQSLRSPNLDSIRATVCFGVRVVVALQSRALLQSCCFRVCWCSAGIIVGVRRPAPKVPLYSHPLARSSKPIPVLRPIGVHILTAPRSAPCMAAHQPPRPNQSSAPRVGRVARRCTDRDWCGQALVTAVIFVLQLHLSLIPNAAADGAG